jgi:hypothetical protein
LVGLARHPHVLHGWRVVVTFHLVAIGWVFFRADSLADAGWIIGHVARTAPWARPLPAESGMNLSPFKEANMNVALALVAFLLVAEWAMARGRGALAGRVPPMWLRWPAYYGVAVVILWLGVMGSRSFIYFQF